MSVLYDTLNTKQVTNLLDKGYLRKDGKRTLSPMLFEGRKIDPAYAEKQNMINFYYVAGDTPGSVYELYSIQCRANDEAKSRLIAHSVKVAINRAFADGVYYRTDILQSIPEEQNAWNTPVEVKIFSGENVQ
jgi:hypothetical protein